MYPPPRFHTWVSFCTYFITYLSISSLMCPSIHLFFYALQRILQISVNFSLITSMCYQHLDCDLLWWMAYVFKMTVQKRGLVVRPLQRNGNLRIKSWTMALLCELKSLMCCMYTWIPSSLPGDQGHFFIPFLWRYQGGQYNSLWTIRFHSYLSWLMEVLYLIWDFSLTWARYK